MIRRCSNPRVSKFQAYGARGITVCERWQKFDNFYTDMGDRPSASHTLDRIDNNGPYSPDNCRWATRTEQARNTRRIRYVTCQGRTLPVSEWAEISGLGLKLICKRLARGWPPEIAVTAPVGFKYLTNPGNTQSKAVRERDTTTGRFV